MCETLTGSAGGYRHADDNICWETMTTAEAVALACGLAEAEDEEGKECAWITCPRCLGDPNYEEWEPGVSCGWGGPEPGDWGPCRLCHGTGRARVRVGRDYGGKADSAVLDSALVAG